MPEATSPPAVKELKVNPGKATWMTASWGNERFDHAVGPAPGSTFIRPSQGYLIVTNEKSELLPGIATDWRISDDGLAWTVTIRKGVKYHDGRELTPQDVLWSLQHVVGPRAFEYLLSDGLGTLSRRMDRIELSGPDKVSLISKSPIPQIGIPVSEASHSWLHVMPKRAKLADPEKQEAYDLNPIGAGPMRLTKHVAAYVMKFERFEDFYYQPNNGFSQDKRVKFKSLDLFLVPEECTRVAAMRAGESDIAPASLEAREQVESGGGRLVFGPEGVLLRALVLGCWKPEFPCSDKRVRQALDCAIDKELIRDRLYVGPEVFQVKGWDVVTPRAFSFSQGVGRVGAKRRIETRGASNSLARFRYAFGYSISASKLSVRK